ncbi:DUF4265 domain-containing protein [Myroides odoratus]|uniref:DUF4265 domain-containing protein n=1 Tax=Myroides odoratus TaxID=256 RepID=A0A9Q7EBU2_MYROD|nr:DUF4265 domain-containing protein [Myroides odoratus]EHQ43600.1 hypothetical protein Myrod_2779 [Myroides odoratus DSM 2801]EKB04143.1 hypothetical protein HMPREF9716_03319 [Myroides odoratus CIP 103059]QQU00920.1 DUF4265 domain-containing protein [Myroides odoratus]WQD56830.1 DUF4265 domain-containing protein [Myroides odoratus]STZ30877.1 Uncharacterised protein [Myroides odoratus]
MKEQYEQIAIQYHSEVLEKETEEILWGIVIDADKNLFQVDNIPFYGPELSCEDIIYATFNEQEKRYKLEHIETPSGNSTIQVMVLKEKYNREDLYNEILYAQTEIELVDDYYFVINVPVKTDYKNVYAILAALEEEQVISFAEPNLSPKHSADIRK